MFHPTMSSICSFSATMWGAPVTIESSHVALATLPRALKNAVSGEESAGQAAFVVLHPPGEELLAVGQHQRQVGRIVCNVAELPRVLLEIEEHRCEPRKVHIFVALIADHIEGALVTLEAEGALGVEVDDIAEIVLPMYLAPPVGRRATNDER